MTRRPYTPLRVAFAKPWPTTSSGFGLWLVSLGLAIRGVGYILNDPSRSTEAVFQLLTVYWGLPMQACGALIVALCGTAALLGYCHFGRVRYGYVLLSFYFGVWSALYASFPVVNHYNSKSTYPDNLAFGVAWQGCLAYMIFASFLGWMATHTGVPKCDLGGEARE